MGIQFWFDEAHNFVIYSFFRIYNELLNLFFSPINYFETSFIKLFKYTHAYTIIYSQAYNVVKNPRNVSQQYEGKRPKLLQFFHLFFFSYFSRKIKREKGKELSSLKPSTPHHSYVPCFTVNMAYVMMNKREWICSVHSKNTKRDFIFRFFFLVNSF